MYHYYYDKYAVSMPPAMKQLGADASKRIADFLRAHPIGATSAVGAAGLGLGHMVGYKSGRAVQRFEDVWDAGNRVLNNKQASYADMSPYLAYAMYGDKTAAPIGSMLKTGFNAAKGLFKSGMNGVKNWANKGIAKETNFLKSQLTPDVLKEINRAGLSSGDVDRAVNLASKIRWGGKTALKGAAAGATGYYVGKGAGLWGNDSKDASYLYANPYWFSDKTAGVNAHAGDYDDGSDNVFIGGWKSKASSRKNPSALGIVSSGLLAGAADDLYTQRRAKGRGVIRSALGYLNAPVGALGGGLAGAALAPVTFGVSLPLGAAAGAAGQVALAGNESPYVHVLPTLGGAGIGAALGVGIGGSVGTTPVNSFNDTGAVIGGLAGAGLGGLAGYSLSRLMN